MSHPCLLDDYATMMPEDPDLQPWIGSLPPEILNQVLGYLDSDTKAKLTRTCYEFYAIITPLLWTELEFHKEGEFHETRKELNEPAPFRTAAQRLYRFPKMAGLATNSEYREELFWTSMWALRNYDLKSTKELAGRVKHLCCNMKPQWTLLPHFGNLESLEVHGDKWAEEFTMKGPVPPHLRYLKLFGYIPRSVAKWFLSSAPNLERLELGMFDRPIGYEGDANPPLPEENFADMSEDADDFGSLCMDCVVPRPLGNFHPAPRKLKLPKLTHLHLLQPARPKHYSMSWSSRAEEACLDSWGALLDVSRETLQVLVLEHRPALEADEDILHVHNRFCWLLSTMAADAPAGLLSLVEETLLAGDNRAKRLTHIYLYGMDIRQKGGGLPSGKTVGGRFMRRLRKDGVKSEARRGRLCIFDSDTGEACFDIDVDNDTLIGDGIEVPEDIENELHELDVADVLKNGVPEDDSEMSELDEDDFHYMNREDKPHWDTLLAWV